MQILVGSSYTSHQSPATFFPVRSVSSLEGFQVFFIGGALTLDLYLTSSNNFLIFDFFNIQLLEIKVKVSASSLDCQQSINQAGFQLEKLAEKTERVEDGE